MLFLLIGGIPWLVAIALGVAGNLITNLGQHIVALRKSG
ncbi:MAG: hypothetical protein AVDCRST_MAG93-4229 [uncultured Chloroflexia bacterium]|uniref:Uncharacterized protein n=1 Tax=uncultured Chloroflexia bacterium TaxID=1672391 RepID=A0A6J4K4S5_9CHLR|nr:MAG: hypothetical protein AVDCRST_MAG93-4229 [uncultured Chloroflexia bacterium]